MLLYALTIFLSAFLLFEVQPLIAKIILPWFGGSAAVWTVCLLFFQVVLLLGYLYSHAVTHFLKPRSQRTLHASLLAASALLLLLLPVLPGEQWKPTGGEDPTGRVLLLLLVTVGLPYFLLSTTGPLLQAWYASWALANRTSTAFPYRLYALSNTGSLLALLSYPIVVEPTLALRQQALGWSFGYVGFALVCGAVALRSRNAVSAAPLPPQEETETEEDAEPDAPKPIWTQYLYWIGLSACSSTLLLAITNHLSQNVASIPFLWILPLSLYLLSFIVCFGGKGWQWKKAFLALPALSLATMAYALSEELSNLSIQFQIPVFAVGLFLCCLICHGELAISKPHPRYLTAFYLMISLGGALGGIFVGLIAPRLFTGYYELPLALGACAILALFTLYRELDEFWQDASWLTLAGLTMLLIAYLIHGVDNTNQNFKLIVRNFYGVLRVGDSDDPTSDDAVRALTHGTIRHGEQFLKPERHMAPTTYYAPESGVGLAIREAQSQPQIRVGVIGLGTGTLACYGRPGDVYRFYDINPLVVQLATTQFTFLRDTKAKTEIAMGDARLSLERELKQGPQNFDVLAVDAFSGDAIPVHLLTKEALNLYFKHLKPDGVLAVHVSNRYLALQPVVAKLAEVLGKEAKVVENDDDDENDISAAEWVLVTGNRDFFNRPRLKDTAKRAATRPGLRIWTDDYSNLFQILKRPGE